MKDIEVDTHLISQTTDRRSSGDIVKRVYSCPCGKGVITEEQDYTEGHRDGMAFLHCPICDSMYYIDFEDSATHWVLRRRHLGETKALSEDTRKKGGLGMNLHNVFYFKEIVDRLYPDEDRPAVDIQSIVEEEKARIMRLSDDDFIEVMISCFIPDLYSGMGKCEKLFTKLTELMVGEWWRRLGGSYHLPTKKSGTEDVELIYGSVSIVCDAKVFRLGRSQKAPNVKDFLKLASVRLWINNLNQFYSENGIDRSVIGGLVTYSSLHEWESDSEVYEECTNHDTPVVMLPYEVMALLLKHKDRFRIDDFANIWQYKENHVQTSRVKANYWRYISSQICSLLSINNAECANAIAEYHRRILLAVAEYRGIVQSSVDSVNAEISHDLMRFTEIEALRAYALHEIERRDNETALDYLQHIDDFRHYSDVDE